MGSKFKIRSSTYRAYRAAKIAGIDDPKALHKIGMRWNKERRAAWGKNRVKEGV